MRRFAATLRASWATPAVCLAALLWYAAYAPFGNITQDEGWLLESSQRVAAGEVPHRDFVSIYPAGRYYLFAAVLETFGGELLAVRGLWCALRALVVALVFAVGRRLMPPGYALGAALFVLVLPGPWHKTFFALIPLAVLAPLGAWLATRHSRWLVAAGVAGGVGVWFRHDVAVAVLGVAGMLVLAASWGFRATRPAREVAFRDVGALALPALAVFGAGWLWISLQAGFGEVFEQLVLRALREGAPSLERARSGAAWWLPRAALGLAGLWLAATSLALLRGRWTARSALAWALALVALLTANQVFRYPVIIRALQCAPVFVVLWFAGAAALAGRLGARSSRAGNALAGLAFALPALAAARLLAGMPIGLPVEYTGSVAVVAARDERFTLPTGTTIFVDRSWAESVDFVRRAAATLPEGAPLVVLGRPSASYFLTGRRNPTRLIRFDESATTETERREALVTMLRDVPLVIADRRFLRVRGKAWAGVLREFYAQRESRGPLLWLERRRARIPARRPTAP